MSPATEVVVAVAASLAAGGVLYQVARTIPVVMRAAIETAGTQARDAMARADALEQRWETARLELERALASATDLLADAERKRRKAASQLSRAEAAELQQQQPQAPPDMSDRRVVAELWRQKQAAMRGGA